jgi:hypothetical protein
VEFYIGTTLLDIENYYPYRYLWQNVAPGTYTLTAKAIDDKGATTKSEAVSVTVKEANVQNRQAPANSQMHLMNW